MFISILKKTINVNFTRKNISHQKVNFGNSGPTIELSRANNHAHLGLNFQSDAGCNWKVHIQTVYEKACNRLNILRMLKHSLCRESLIKFYMSFIRPILEYGDIIWDNCSERDAALLEDVQITVARIITGLRITSSRSILYNELGWDALFVRRKVHKLIYKIIYGLAPHYLQDLLKSCFPPQTSYPLWNQNGLTFLIPQARTSSYIKKVVSHQLLNYGIIY